MLSLLVISFFKWAIPWAGIGAIALGLGSAFTGAAAIKTARKGRNESQQQNGTSDSKQLDNGSGERGPNGSSSK